MGTWRDANLQRHTRAHTRVRTQAHKHVRERTRTVGVIFQARFQAPALNEGGGFDRHLPLNKGGGFGATLPPVEGGGFGQLSLKSKTPTLIEGGGFKTPRVGRVTCDV